MLTEDLKLNLDVFSETNKRESTREGFGLGIIEAAEENKNILALTGDLTESVQLHKFKEKYPDRFIQVGIAEQNMAGIASGLALSNKIPFVATYACFSPSRNWDQIRVSICMQNVNVKLVGSHAGISAGPDGATAQALEDVALMRVLPNMKVIYPIDSEQAKKAIITCAKTQGPCYIRLAREKTPLITTNETPFEIGKAYKLTEGNDLTIITSGPITYEVLLAARNIKAKHKISCEVIASPTIKPLDEGTIIESVTKTGKAVTVEEHQITAGLGGAVAEMLTEFHPVKLLRIGINDTFGESGSYADLLNRFGLSSHNLEQKIMNFMKGTK